MKKICFENYNYTQVPQDVRKYVERLNGVCGEAAIAALFDISVEDVFKRWGIDESTFKGWTTEKEMKIILENFGYVAKRKRVSDKHHLPNSDFAIVRVSFGEPEQHWAKTARESHYIALRRFNQGCYVFDNAIDSFDGQEINGIWIEKSEYYKWMEAEKMFVTSYLELIESKQQKNDTEVSEAKALRTPPTSELVGIRAGDLITEYKSL